MVLNWLPLVPQCFALQRCCGVAVRVREPEPWHALGFYELQEHVEATGHELLWARNRCNDAKSAHAPELRGHGLPGG